MVKLKIFEYFLHSSENLCTFAAVEMPQVPHQKRLKCHTKNVSSATPKSMNFYINILIINIIY